MGPGRKNIGGEVKLKSLERALELREEATSYFPILKTKSSRRLQRGRI